MRNLMRVAAVLAVLAGPSPARAQGQVTFETGDVTYFFAATGFWTAPVGRDETARGIDIWATHADSTTMRLTFQEEAGRAAIVRMRFQEPATADAAGRKWVEEEGFRLTLAPVRREGDRLVLEGRYDGYLIDPRLPWVRAGVGGDIDVTLDPAILSSDERPTMGR